MRRLLRARRERVFEAWTRPDLMARWFYPGDGWTAEVVADVRVGGRYELVMRDAAGVLHTQFGEYREIVPESRLVFTWSCPELSVADSVVTVDLIDHGEGAELLLSHELPPDPKIRRGHEEGWEGCLGNLEKMLSDTSKGDSDERDQG
ncbi:MAG TPA: SRPBCC domain-containing protein [Thermoanaerobaculia bacterium]|nr:SRPBCC domain-containing protein [Thermoanaerobaculia bacterium]